MQILFVRKNIQRCPHWYSIQFILTLAAYKKCVQGSKVTHDINITFITRGRFWTNLNKFRKSTAVHSVCTKRSNTLTDLLGCCYVTKDDRTIFVGTRLSVDIFVAFWIYRNVKIAFRKSHNLPIPKFWILPHLEK